jgi:hypothetical protein
MGPPLLAGHGDLPGRVGDGGHQVGRAGRLAQWVARAAQGGAGARVHSASVIL